MITGMSPCALLNDSGWHLLGGGEEARLQTYSCCLLPAAISGSICFTSGPLKSRQDYTCEHILGERPRESKGVGGVV